MKGDNKSDHVSETDNKNNSGGLTLVNFTNSSIHRVGEFVKFTYVNFVSNIRLSRID